MKIVNLQPMGKRATEWIKRYLPAEVFSYAITAAAIILSNAHSDSRVVIALSGTWAGNIAYYAYILIADVMTARAALHKEGKRYTYITFLKNIRALVAEFGMAEVLDAFFIRPALMYYIPLWMNSMLTGSIIAKFAADVLFYIPAIIGYELTKSRLRKFD